VNTLVRDIGRENLPAFINRMRANPSLAPMDVAPGVQTRAIGIAKGEPSPGQTHLFDTVAERVRDRREAVRNAYGGTIGEVPNTVELLDKMKADARAVGQQQIEPALKGAGPVDVTPVVKAIDEEVGPYTIRALQKGRQPPQGLNPTQQRLLQLRQELTFRDSKTGNPFPNKDLSSEACHHSPKI
jgi:hypothetical protein